MEWIDLSVPLKTGMHTYPGDIPFEMKPLLRIAHGKVCNLSALQLGTHAGTHVDPPWHFVEDGIRVDELPLDLLIGKAYVVSVRSAPAVTADSLAAADVPEGTERLLIQTDNSFGVWDKTGFQPDFVYLAPEAAEWIVQKGIRLVGIDYLSIEQFRAPQPLAHRTLLGAGVIVVEGLNLRALEPGWVRFICLPLRIEGGDGAPARAVARRIE
ncbi:MAG: cyclase family protein [Armatimonadota bacterium]|nr:cyclase family protein [bacterium]MDW8320898.1 cyclase family protein [Armatimonadota bacterium]